MTEGSKTGVPPRPPILLKSETNPVPSKDQDQNCHPKFSDFSLALFMYWLSKYNGWKLFLLMVYL